MRNLNSHQIKKQLINLDLLNTTDPARCQRELSYFITKKLLPDIETLFDNIAGKNNLYIDKIIVDVGDVQESDWKNKLTSTLLNKLQGLLRSTMLSEQHANIRKLEETEITTNSNSKFNQLLLFLKYGYVSCDEKNNRLTIFESLVNTIVKNQWFELTKLIISDNNARHRLINNFSDHFINELFYINTSLVDISHQLNTLAPVEKNHRVFNYWRNYCLNSLLIDIVAANSSLYLKKSIIRNIVVVREVVLHIVKLSVSAGVSDKPMTFNIEVARLKSVIKPWGDCFNEFDLIKVTVIERNPVKLLQGIVISGQYREINQFVVYQGYQYQNIDSDKPILNINNLSDIKKTDDHDSIASKCTIQKIKTSWDGSASLNNPVSSKAGLQAKPDMDLMSLSGVGVILLHPFLPELFRSQKLLQGNNFLDVLSQQQALHMLRYLSFGDKKVAEYELLFAKLLCNMPWAEALMFDALPEEHKLACDELMSALMQHWSALKSSSADWVRVQFFLRTGRLIEHDEHWSLDVDSQAQDVLLTKLPWGIGTIHLPWMEKLIHVNWNH